jgi:hypothetical protein
LLVVGVSTPVVVFLADTVAPGTAAPLGSVTTPLTLPVTVWHKPADAMMIISARLRQRMNRSTLISLNISIGEQDPRPSAA